MKRLTKIWLQLLPPFRHRFSVSPLAAGVGKGVFRHRAGGRLLSFLDFPKNLFMLGETVEGFLGKNQFAVHFNLEYTSA